MVRGANELLKPAPDALGGPETGLEGPKSAEATKDLVYTFRISRRAAPIEFRNLWELAYKGPGDLAWHVEIDVDMLSTCITRINYIFELDGL